MPISGFVTRTEIKHKVQTFSDSGLSNERLRELGLRGVENMNPKAKNPCMDPWGSKHPQVYVLGEGPGPAEDAEGIPFVGPSGQLLFKYIPRDKKLIRVNNVVRTLPLRRNGILKPTHHEIQCFTPSLEEDIAETKPKIILALGDTACYWCLGSSKISMGALCGKRFPAEIGGHYCWVYTSHHPFWILYKLNSGEYSQIPGTEYEKYFARDVRRPFDDLEELEKPEMEDPDHYWNGVRYETQDVDKIVRFLKSFHGKQCTIDLETNRKRPYHAGAKILTFAIGGEDNTLAFPYLHPQAKWSKSQCATLKRAIGEFLNSRSSLIAHHASFDMEWMVSEWGPDILFNSKWHCTQAQAYLLDERKGGKSLDFLSTLHFGLRLKAVSSGSVVSSLFGTQVEDIVDQIDRSQLEKTNLMDVLKYNGLDTKYTDKLFMRQSALIEREGLMDTYRQFIKRIPCIVLAQHRGLPVDQKVVQKHRKKLTRRIDVAVQDIQHSKPVRLFVKRYGKFNPDSPNDCVKMFRDFLGRSEGQRGKSYSTDEEVLSQMTDEPLAASILRYRGLTKLRGTYVERMMLDHKDPLVYPDGHLHPIFKYTKTDTSRESSADPNGQNFPKRDDAWIRRQVVPPKGHVVVTCDYGQQEYRAAAMLSHDKVLVDSCYTNFDVHAYWAKEIIKVWPKTFEQRHGRKDEKAAFKAFRGEVKNQMVFPALYRSKATSIANSLDMPIRVFDPLFARFWSMLEGVKRWQDEVIHFYKKYGYTETLGGFRRHGPTSENQICNMPIQGSSADMTNAAWWQCCREGYRRELEYLFPVLMIHDDLTFFIPEDQVEKALPIIVSSMLFLKFKWINVPLVVEVSVGPNWCDLKKYNEYRSDKYQSQN